MARLDEQLVPSSAYPAHLRARARRRRRSRRRTPVAIHTSPATMCSGTDLEGGGHQRHKLRIVAPYRLRAETEIRQRGRLLDPGEPDVMSGASAVSQTPARRRAA